MVKLALAAAEARLRRPMLVVAGASVIVFSTITFIVLFATATGTVDFLGRPLGTDFSNIWTAGLMVLEGRAPDVYHWPLHYAVQQEVHGRADIPFFGWHYPPFFLSVAALLALLPYIPALFLWQATTFAAAVLLVRRIVPDPVTTILAVGLPAGFICLAHGHNGFLTAALLTGAMLALDRRPVVAGILIGLVAYKPQFALLLPAVLLAGGHLRAFAAAAVTVALATLFTFAAWGWPVWQAFFETTHLTRTIVLEAGDTGWHKIQSAFSFVRMWGGSIPLAYAVQGLATAAVLVASVWLWRSPADHRLKSAGLLAGALLSTPYLFDYDMVVLGPAIAFYAAYGLEHGFRPGERLVLALAWFLPIVVRAIMQMTGFPAGFLLMAAFFAMVVRRAGAERTEGMNPAGRTSHPTIRQRAFAITRR
jgi:hypothetical protein